MNRFQFISFAHTVPSAIKQTRTMMYDKNTSETQLVITYDTKLSKNMKFIPIKLITKQLDFVMSIANKFIQSSQLLLTIQVLLHFNLGANVIMHLSANLCNTSAVGHFCR
jgi:hypothetical protein